MFAMLMTATLMPAEPGLLLWRGSESAAFETPAAAVEPYDRAVLSWNATGGGVFELDAGDGVWRVMGRWGERPRSEKTEQVDVDTLKLATPSTSVRVRATPDRGAKVTLLAVTTWRRGAKAPLARRPSAAWGKTIAVKHRAQAAAGSKGSRLCSPTCLGMVLESHGTPLGTTAIAERVYDHAEDIYGNWPFNTAYAHQASGLQAYVRRFSALEELEAEIAAGRPVIASYKFRNGELEGAPIKNTDGHLVVVAGFTADGDVVVADPAGRDGEAPRVYKREQFYKAWLENASGVGYVIRRP